MPHDLIAQHYDIVVATAVSALALLAIYFPSDGFMPKEDDR